MLTVALRRLPHGADLPLPAYATPLSAGVDLFAAVSEPVALTPLARALVPTGIAIALPSDHEAQVRPRSGLAARHGLTILNSPGTIDADYRGEIQVILINLGADAFVLERGQRIAQLVVAPVTRVAWRETAVLAETTRGAGGFGSTGIASNAGAGPAAAEGE
jgi:dUTP pyrophosphatase